MLKACSVRQSWFRLFCVSLVAAMSMVSLRASNESSWLGKVLTDNYEAALKYAAENNRPLIVDYGYEGCGECDLFYSNVIGTSGWSTFLRNQKIVMYKTKTIGEFNKLFSQWSEKDYKMGGSYPWLVMYHVTANTVNGKTTYEVKTPKTTEGNKWTIQGIGLGGMNTLFGVKLPATQSMSATHIGELVNAWFPNNYWESITGDPVDPDPVDPDPVDPDPVDPDDPDEEVLKVAVSTSGGESSGSYPALEESKWLGKVLTNQNSSADDALKYAAENNRPLIVDFGYEGCGECDLFHERVIGTTGWANFLKNEKLVMYRTLTLAELNKLYGQWSGKDYQMGGSYPRLVMYQVTAQTANGTTTYVVQTPKTTEGNYWTIQGIGLGGMTTLFGVKLPSTSNMSSRNIEELVKAWFPNNYWDSIEAKKGLSGYDKAVSLGTVSTSRVSKTSQASGAEPQFWYKFTGKQGVRYHFETKKVGNNALVNTTGMSFTARLYAVSNGVPADPVIYSSVSDSGLDGFAHGFYLDSPSGSATNQTYYVQIQGKGGKSSTITNFELFCHETIANPAAGSFTNPAWSGATLGKWTMDLAAAKAASASTGKPILIYLGGTRWDDAAIAWQHKVFASATFATATKNYYLVHLDFRREDKSGPSILFDTYYGHTADAIETLNGNQEFLESLGMESVDGIPWLVVALPRIITRSAADEGLSLVAVVNDFEMADGALDSDAEIHSLFTQFNALVAMGQTVDTQTMEGADVLESEEEKNLLMGGLVTDYWTTFQVTNGMPWTFGADVTGEITQGAKLVWTVMDGDGDPLVLETKKLEESNPFFFFPEEMTTEPVYLWLHLEGQESLLNLTLQGVEGSTLPTFEFEQTDVYVYRYTDGRVAIPVQYTYGELPEEGTVGLYYDVQTTGDSIAARPAWFGGVQTALPMEWGTDEEELPVDEDVIWVPIQVPANQPANAAGEWTFQVKLHPYESGEEEFAEYSVGREATVIVHICATNRFVSNETEDFVLQQKIGFRAEFPLIASDDVTFTVASGSLPKGVYAFIEDSALVVEGVPTTVSKKQNVKFRLDSGDEKTVSFRVDAVSSNVFNLAGMTSLLQEEGNSGESIDGLLTIVQNEDWSLNVTLKAMDVQDGLEAYNLPWTSYEDGMLVLFYQWDDGSTLTVHAGEVNSDGAFSESLVTFVSAYDSVYTGTLLAPMNASHLTGYYNVALRQGEWKGGDFVGTEDGLSFGYVTMEITNDGNAGQTEPVVWMALGQDEEYRPGTTFVSGGLLASSGWGSVPLFMAYD